MRMRGYIESLHKLVEQQNEERERVKQQQAATAQVAEPDQVKSMDSQITELMNSLPPAQANRAWTMEDLVMRLQGLQPPALAVSMLRPHSGG